MKKLWIALAVVIVIGLAGFFVAGYYLGNVPVASSLLGTNEPRDLGVEVTADAAYSGMKNVSLPATAEELLGIRENPASFTTFTGSLSDAEAASLFSTADIPNLPLRLTQIKFGDNGNVRVSGVIFTEDLQEFLRDLGVSGGALDTVMGYVKNVTAMNYYFDGTCSVINNHVNLELNKLEIGRISLPDSVVKDSLGNIGNTISNALTSNGFNIRKLTISEGQVDLDMDRPLGSLSPWLDFVQY